METSKSPEIVEFLDSIAPYGYNDKCCATCGSTKIKPEDFRNDISRKEYLIGRMCQECQDSVFGKD